MISDSVGARAVAFCMGWLVGLTIAMVLLPGKWALLPAVAAGFVAGVGYCIYDDVRRERRH